MPTCSLELSRVRVKCEQANDAMRRCVTGIATPSYYFKESSFSTLSATARSVEFLTSPSFRTSTKPKSHQLQRFYHHQSQKSTMSPSPYMQTQPPSSEIPLPERAQLNAATQKQVVDQPPVFQPMSKPTRRNAAILFLSVGSTPVSQKPGFLKRKEKKSMNNLMDCLGIWDN